MSERPNVIVQQRFNQYYCVYASWCNCFALENYSYENFEKDIMKACKWIAPNKWKTYFEEEKMGEGWSPSVKMLLLKYANTPYDWYSARKGQMDKLIQIENGFLDIISGGHYSHSIAVRNGYVIDSLTGYKPQVYKWTGKGILKNYEDVGGRVVSGLDLLY